MRDLEVVVGRGRPSMLRANGTAVAARSRLTGRAPLCGVSEHRKRGSAVGLARASMTKWTEQGAYLDGIDRPQAPALREEDTAEMLDRLTRYLSKQPGELTGHR